MKNILQKAVTGICLLIMFYYNISAQGFSATYVNDLNGNRVTETVIYLKTNIQSLAIPLDSVINKDTTIQKNIKLPQDGWLNGPVDSSSNMIISLYPNPTHGIVLVEISGIGADKLSNNNNLISVRDIRGNELETIKPLNNYNTVNLSTLADGVYIIGISINGNIKNYKVIKN